MRLASGIVRTMGCLMIAAGAAHESSAQSSPVEVPRIDHPLTVDAFVSDRVRPDPYGDLARIEGYYQRVPRDGQPISEPTTAYLAHDGQHLYVAVVAGYVDPTRMRAHLVRREDNETDDWVNLLLDTFNDQRRGYMMGANAYGVQWDALWTEGQGYDKSVDLLFTTDVRRTRDGFVVLFTVPFSSLRFPAGERQLWRLMLGRGIQTADEQSFWPEYSTRIEGRLNQAGVIRLHGVKGGRGFELIPSLTSRGSRSRDGHAWTPLAGQIDGGLDTKLVMADRVVIDATLNPDFGQIESDEPQVTVNQRFELFFPEKRPFFLENANYFQTPIPLVFTRRIVAPEAGIRLTTKTGSYAVGALVARDEVSPDAPSAAHFAIARVARDLFRQGSIGVLATVRDDADSRNAVAAFDGRLKFGQNWTALWQVARSDSERAGEVTTGTAWSGQIARTGRQLQYTFTTTGFGPGFATDSGYVPRVDTRRIQQDVSFRFRPEGRLLLAWGPTSMIDAIWDYEGTRLEWWRKHLLEFQFWRQTNVALGIVQSSPSLRPRDHAALVVPTTYAISRPTVSISTIPTAWLALTAVAFHGTEVNYVPAVGQRPSVSNFTSLEFTSTVRPGRRLVVQTAYLFTRLEERLTSEPVLSNHVLRSRWQLQFTKEWSLRTIVRYDRTRAASERTALTDNGNLNADVLLTWMLNPWTAIYAGYNGNGADELEAGRIGPPTWRRNADQVFVKMSYLWRP